MPIRDTRHHRKLLSKMHSGTDAPLAPGDFQKRSRTLTPLLSARAILSELFVDTELDELGLISIAESLATTGLPSHEIQRIYEDEVSPACHWIGPVGPWPSIDLDALMQRIEKQRTSVLLKAVRSIFGSRLTAVLTSSTREDFDRVKHYLEHPGEMQTKAEAIRRERGYID